jgi:hypothetical protein
MISCGKLCYKPEIDGVLVKHYGLTKENKQEIKRRISKNTQGATYKGNARGLALLRLPEKE